jgi:predicted ATP-dependent endonuclease of OLD family
MKILNLHIDQFKHLENLEFNFISKKGQPLNKICFIGQSATGKTGILELIYEHTSNVLNLELIDNTYLAGLSNPIKNINGEINLLIDNEVLLLRNKGVFFKGDNYKYENKGGSVTPLVPTPDKKNIFYFKANLISDKSISFLSTNPIELIEKHSEELKQIEKDSKYKQNHSIIFNDDLDTKIWLRLLNSILNYRKNHYQKMSELIRKGLLGDTTKLNIEYSKWQKDNPNVLEQFAKEFNPILEKLNLEVDLINTEYSIPIKNKRTEEIIPFQDTSTGTKQLLLTSLPLYSLDSKDSIILIDEPERSLYPDMQMDLMDYYQNLAPEAQFIVATHSPFIAASFEADERFILYFDEDGKVAVRRGSSPIGDDPNDMLYNDFGINYINKFGQAKYNEYLDLKQKIHFEKDEKIKKEYAEKLEKIGDEYNF